MSLDPTEFTLLIKTNEISILLREAYLDAQTIGSHAFLIRVLESGSFDSENAPFRKQTNGRVPSHGGDDRIFPICVSSPPPPLFEIMFRIKYLPGRQSDRKRRRKNATVRIPVFTHARLGRNLKRVRTKFVNAIACSFWSLEYEHVDRPPPAASARDNKPANGFCSRNRV